jgi:hypothetical protein
MKTSVWKTNLDGHEIEFEFGGKLGGCQCEIVRLPASRFAGASDLPGYNGLLCVEPPPKSNIASNEPLGVVEQIKLRDVSWRTEWLMKSLGGDAVSSNARSAAPVMLISRQQKAASSIAVCTDVLHAR